MKAPGNGLLRRYKVDWKHLAVAQNCINGQHSIWSKWFWTDTSTDASVDISIATLNRHATNMSIDCRPRVDGCFGRDSTDVAEVSTVTISGSYQSTTGGISVNYRRNVGRVSFDSRARVYQYYLPIYRPILSVILDTIHRCIDQSIGRYTCTSTDTWALFYRPVECRPMYQPIYRLILTNTLGEG